MRSWMAVGLLALVLMSAVAAGGGKHAKVVDFSELSKLPTHFQAGNEYVFEYNAQMASGLNEPSTPFEFSNDQNNEQNPQKAITRMQAQVQIHFTSAQRAYLQLANVRLGSMNGRQVADAKRIQPMSMFESRSFTDEQRENYETPCAFDYVDGVVERIHFAASETVWSKNMKRAILNLIQVNLSGKPSSQLQPRHYAGAFSTEVQPAESYNQAKSFAVLETGIGGECLTAYTVNGACLEQEQQSNCNGFNVTKSVDFKQCSRIADVTFGFDSRNEQSEKCVHMSHNSQLYGPNAFPTVDDESCDPKQLNEENMHRSTVSRIECAGGNVAKCAIKRAETLSHYVLKNSFDTQNKAEMHTIAVSRLNFRGQRVASSSSPAARQSAGPTGSESLMYDNAAEADQKRFFMLGDKCNNCEMRSKGGNEKVSTAVELYRKLIDATLNKRIGVEGGDAMQIQRLIEILRICTAAELQAIHKEVKNSPNADEKRVHELQADALAAAGTRNTIQALMKKIQDGHISPAQASKSLKNLNNMPAPSDEIASELWSLCESEPAQRSPALRQSCMLTFGATVGAMCGGKIFAKSQQREHPMQPRFFNNNDETHKEQQLFVFGKQTGFNNQKANKNNNNRHNPEEELACAPHKKQFYKEVLIQQFNRASSIYEKILAIKTLGNAGLDNTIHELEAIITGRQGEPSPIVRAAAIDALRRLRHQMPHKIQRICLPAYQNVRAPQHVRSVAFRMLMSTRLSSPILDQILYTLSKERSSQLQRIAFTTVQAFAESPIGEHRQMAKHLKNALKLSNIDGQKLTMANTRFQIPLYSRVSGDGILINLLSVFSDVNSMPIHLSAGADAVFGGKRQENMFKLSVTQQGMSEALEHMAEAMVSQAQHFEKTTRANRASTGADAELRDIFAQLAIKSRQQKHANGARGQSAEPFGMVVFRIGNMDQAILPLTADDAEAAAAFAANRSPSHHHAQATGASLWHSFVAGGSQGIRSLALTTFNDKSAFISTSVGVTLKMTRASPLLTCIEAKATTENNKVITQGHAIAAGAHIQKTESTCLLGGSGVESARVFETNIPLNAELEFGTGEQTESSVKLTWSVPQQKTRLLGVHTFMHTFIYESHKCTDTAKRHTLTVQHPAVHSQFGARTKQINTVVGERSFGIPLRISGHFAAPSHLSDPSAWLQLAMASENHLHLTLEPTAQTPKEISWQAQGALFRRAQSSHLVKALKKLDEIYQNHEQNFQTPFSQNDEKAVRKTQQQRENLQKAIEKIAEQNANKGEAAVYQHKVELSVQTNGGARTAHAELAVDATCDARFQACASSIKMKRSPIYAGESNNWQAEADAQMILPETVSSPAEWERLNAKKHQKFLARMNSQWGTNQEQSLKIRVQGQNTQWKYDNLVNNDNTDVNNKRAAFLNQFDVACDYKLEPQAQNFFTRYFETLKAYQFWNIEMPAHTNSRDGQAFARLHIEPKNAQKAHFEIRTPTQTVHIKNVRLPYQTRPMPLIRSSHSSTHSVAQMFARAMRSATRAECAVSGHSVETFDGMRFNGPVTSSCYSVLAKDCANQQQPQYSVLMKSLESNGQQKKIRVIVPGQKIECQAKNINEYDEFEGNKITCTINGKPVHGQSSRVPSWGKSSSEENEQPFKNAQTSPIVEFNNEERTAVTINAPSGALTVRFACQCADCKCQKAWIQLSSAYKNAQCGLCGHFDNDATNEWRNANNEDATQDPVAFHRSYSIVKDENDDNEDNVCTNASQDKFYQQHKQKFGFLKRPIKTINADGQWSDESNSNEDEGFFEPPQDYFGEYAHSDDSNENNYFNSKRRFSNSIIDPVMKTKIIEHHHQMCFSKSPVNQCPEGSSPTNGKDNKSDEEGSTPWNANEGTTNKMGYVCVPRDEAGPFIRAISSGHPSRVSEMLRQELPSFNIVEREPTACRRH